MVTTRSKTNQNGRTTTSKRHPIQTRPSAYQASVTAKAPVIQVSFVSSAPPPWHAVALIGFLSAVFLRILPSIKDIDALATEQVFAERVFPDYLSLRALAMIRLLFAMIIWVTSIHTMLGPGWTQTTTYLKTSRLRMVENRFSGIKTMFPFTSWCWNLLGMAFSLSGWTAWQIHCGQTVSPWILRTALLVWQVAAPFTLLVASVIRYVIWPGVLKAKASTANLKSWRNVFMHNLNVVLAVVEVALLGGLPVDFRFFSLAPLVGCAYVVFSWAMVGQWNTPEAGPQFIYFFFDTTLGVRHTLALILLFMVLMVDYGVFCLAERLLQWLDGGMLTHAAFGMAVSASVMRFRD